MEEETIPFQVSKGMVICGSFRSETDYWKTKIAPRVPDCLDREKMHIQRIVPTPRSTMQ